MGCACKQAKILAKKYQANSELEERNTKYYIKKTFETFTYILLNRIFMPAFLLLLGIILFPLLLLMLIMTQITKGQATVIVPKQFLDKMKLVMRRKHEEKIKAKKLETSGE